MKTRIFATLALLGSLAAPALAHAQVAGAGAYSGSTASTLSSSGAYGTGGSVSQTFTSPEDQTIHIAPSVSAPPIYTSVCTGVSASLGVSAMSVGVTGGFAKESRPCNIRADMAMAESVLGDKELAVALACQDADFKAAYASLPNDPCPTAPGGAVATPAAQVVTAPPVPALPAPVICHQVFVPPADPNGAGYMAEGPAGCVESQQ